MLWNPTVIDAKIHDQRFVARYPQCSGFVLTSAAPALNSLFSCACYPGRRHLPLVEFPCLRDFGYYWPLFPAFDPVSPADESAVLPLSSLKISEGSTTSGTVWLAGPVPLGSFYSASSNSPSSLQSERFSQPSASFCDQLQPGYPNRCPACLLHSPHV